MAVPRHLVAVAVVMLCVVFALSPPEKPKVYDNDQYLYQDTVRRMRHGADYYEASERTFTAVGGTIETARGFRPPTAFLFWRLLPEGALWPAFLVLVVGATGMILLATGVAPLAALLTVLYLLVLGRFSVEYLFVELWAVPLVAGSLAAAASRRWWLAAGLALGATAVRELAVLLIVGGVWAAIAHRQRLRPWLTALVSAAALYALHVVLLSDHLGRHGTEARLLGTGSPGAAARMMGFQLPAALVVGPVLWVSGLVWLHRSGRLALAGPFAALPLLGLVADRPYWGALVVPFLLAWTYELVSGLASRGTVAAHE
jgi:hypothetical protein